MQRRSLLSFIAAALLAAQPSCKGDGSEDDTSTDEPGDTTTEEIPDVVEEDPATEPTMDINGRIETVDGMEVMWLWGTREEMGYAEGALMCGRLRTMLEDYVLDFVVPDSGYDYLSLQALVTLSYTVPEGDERELEAMILGVHERCEPEDRMVESENLEPSAGGRREITLDDLKIAHALADWACSSFTVWGDAAAGTGTIHARNLDWMADPGGVILDQHLVKVYQSSEDGDARWVSVTVPGLIGCISCINEEGTGIMIHNSNGLDPSVMAGNVARMLSSRAAVVEALGATDKVDAVEILLETRPKQVGDNFHMPMHCDDADMSCIGGVALEYDGNSAHTDGLVTVRAPGDVDYGLTTTQGIVVTNHYLERRPSTDCTYTSSLDRFDAVLDALNAIHGAGGSVDMDSARDVIETAVQGSTVHTVILDTASMTLRVYVSEAATPAPSTTPHVLDLATLFAGFPG